MYLASNRLPYDSSTSNLRDLGNQSIFDYLLNVDVPARQAADAIVPEMAEHPNLHMHLGFGTADALHMDVDSQLRLDSSMTRTRTKLSLNTSREFVANPDKRSAYNVGKGPADSAVPQYIDNLYSSPSRGNGGNLLQQDDEHEHLAATIHHPNLESTATCNKKCKQLTERDFTAYTMTPLIGSMRDFIANDVPLNVHAIGENSRDSFRGGDGQVQQNQRFQ